MMQFEQRVFKFRVWYKPLKAMCTFWTLEIATESVVIDLPNGVNEIVKQADCILTQWTGLTDKYGTDIYEGDVISTDGDFCGISKPYITTIEYVAAAFVYFSYFPLCMSVIDDHHIKVIGNVFEHPDLLEVNDG